MVLRLPLLLLRIPNLVLLVPLPLLLPLLPLPLPLPLLLLQARPASGPALPKLGPIEFCGDSTRVGTTVVSWWLSACILARTHRTHSIGTAAFSHDCFAASCLACKKSCL